MPFLYRRKLKHRNMQGLLNQLASNLSLSDSTLVTKKLQGLPQPAAVTINTPPGIYWRQKEKLT